MDTLSGEFQATATPEKLHTLGRLAVTTFNTGKQVEPTHEDKDLVGRIGEISAITMRTNEFGTDVESKLLLRADARLHTIQYATGLILKKKDASIAFIDKDPAIIGNTIDHLLIQTIDFDKSQEPYRETRYELPLAINDIDNARTIATTLAQGFVN
jgi:hypothetical protein